MTRKRLTLGLILIAFTGLLGTCVLLYSVFARSRTVFLTSMSPEKVYVVSLKGQRTQPLFFTSQVRFDVNKIGRSLISDKVLHSGDSEDFSFQFRYPDHRWLSENCIHFYNEEAFRNRVADRLIVVNNSGKTIKYLQIDSVEKVLLFELQPGARVVIPSSQSRGDLKRLDVAGDFSDGKTIDTFGQDFAITNTAAAKTYYVTVQLERIAVEMR